MPLVSHDVEPEPGRTTASQVRGHNGIFDNTSHASQERDASIRASGGASVTRRASTGSRPNNRRISDKPSALVSRLTR